MGAYPGFAAQLGGTRVEAALKRPLRVINPFVEVADHVVDDVATPNALAALGRAGPMQQWAAFSRGQIQPRIEMSFGGISMEKYSRMRLSENVAGTGHVLVTVRELLVLFSAAGQHPFVLGAQALARAAACLGGSVPIQIAAGDHVGSRALHGLDRTLGEQSEIRQVDGVCGIGTDEAAFALPDRPKLAGLAGFRRIIRGQVPMGPPVYQAPFPSIDAELSCHVDHFGWTPARARFPERRQDDVGRRTLARQHPIGGSGEIELRGTFVGRSGRRGSRRRTRRTTLAVLVTIAGRYRQGRSRDEQTKKPSLARVPGTAPVDRRSGQTRSKAPRTLHFPRYTMRPWLRS